LTLHPKRCGLCALCRKDPVAYDDSLFCTYDGALTLVAKPIIRFIAVRGCASFLTEDKETVAKLVIKEEVINKAMQTRFCCVGGT
jgi:hypothetical protein